MNEVSTGEEARAPALLVILRALADPVRLQILESVLRQPRNVGDLVRQCGLSQPDVSHHLRRLREAGLLQGRREGRQIWYAPVERPSAEAQLLLATLRRLWRLAPDTAGAPQREARPESATRGSEAARRRSDLEDYLL